MINGIIGKKLGMTQVFTEDARAVPVTVIKAGPCYVTQVKTEGVDGYNAVQISFGGVKPNRANKPDAGHFAKAGVAPARHLVEIRVDSTDGFVKAIADADSKSLLGVVAVGRGVSEFIGEATLALEMGAFLEDVALTIHPHPTMSEALQEAIEGALGQAVHMVNK